MAGLNCYFYPTPEKIISTDDVTVTKGPASVGSGVLERPATASGAAFVHRDMLYRDKILKVSTPMAADESRVSEDVGSTESIPNSESEDTSLDTHVCIFFKKSSKGKNIRKRPMVEEGENEEAEGKSSIIFTKKKPAAADHMLHFSTGSSKSNTPTESSVDSKATRFHFESSKKIQLQTDNRATSTLETETEFSKDARTIRERALKLAEEALKGKSKTGGDEKLYKGMNQYIDYKFGLKREHTISSEKAGGAHGPLRASAHIRVSTRFDYQPDICKDYKETGYCGYGDSCKFMHDRGDYKSGWQLEKEWDEAEKERKRKLAIMGMLEEDDEDAENDDALPFACFICREPFVDPVVTKCKHYFCEHCALKHHAKNKKCFVCNQPTLGIFNIAFEIRKRMAAQGK